MSGSFLDFFFVPIIAYSACDSFLGRSLSLTLLNFRREYPIAVTFKFTTVSSSAGSYTECPLILRLSVIQAILHAQNVKVLKNVFRKLKFFWSDQYAQIIMQNPFTSMMFLHFTAIS